jgi:hypothetical protein
MEKDFLFVLRVKPATADMPWQATLKDPKSEEKRIFRYALALARHLERLTHLHQEQGSSSRPIE